MAKIEENNQITLGLLNAVDESSSVTQRAVAKELGIALGLVNTYLKRCVKKGLIKVSQVPANRYAYYLTPKGFSEKARLTGEYLSQGFQLFRLSRSQLVQIMEDCENQGLKKIVLVGAGDITEIAILCAQEFDLGISGILVDNDQEAEFGSIRVVNDILELEDFDAIILTSLDQGSLNIKKLPKQFDINRIFTPPILETPTSNNWEAKEL
tara:strand:- start:3974 stop:4603 length:630 start_codon:yes stop_codon:yes gene_type:complete